jgi:hypothetical protein
MSPSQVKLAVAWFKKLAKLASDDATRPGIHRAAVKVASGVWALTNGHYAIVTTPPAELADWDETIPVCADYGWPMDLLADQAAITGNLDYSESVGPEGKPVKLCKIGLVERKDATYPQLHKVLAAGVHPGGNHEPRRPMPDMSKILAALDLEIERLNASVAPDADLALLAFKQGLRGKPGVTIAKDSMLKVWALGDAAAPLWTAGATLTEWFVDDAGTVRAKDSQVALGPAGEKGDLKVGMLLKYARLLAKAGPWQGGWMYEHPALPMDLRFGRDFAVLMPCRL